MTSLDLPRLRARLQRLYGERAGEALELLLAAVERVELSSPRRSGGSWDQTDVVLITYGDQVSSDGRNPLQTLLQFLTSWELPGLISTIHLLPCFPYSSDDGFSVIDYRTIDPNLGTWDDVHQIGQVCQLMLDFVVNHASQQSEWFQRYLRGQSPYDRYFIEMDPAEDLSGVTRPRSLPLLSDFQTSRGNRWLWTTFSRDQVDLDYSEPAVLAEAMEVLLDYARHGATIIRLDAIAYLWKRVGTSCIHLPETHEVVRLMRDVFNACASQVLLLTETNVPHDENVSYFGDGDEAHMVYQFSLPPLLLDALLNEDAEPLKRWLANLEDPPNGATYFNFTASHDGIGVRPLQGHVSDTRLASLIEKIKARGGLIGTRRRADGTDSPYELNISYVDAVAGNDGDIQLHARRFLASQAVMLALKGMPAVYFHSLVGTQNDLQGVKASDIPRRINRQKFQLRELTDRISAPGTLQQLIFTGMKALLRLRVAQPAFHPDASQRYVESNSPHILCFERRCRRAGQSILVAVNFGDEMETVELPSTYTSAQDLLSSEVERPDNPIKLKPAQIVWLEAGN